MKALPMERGAAVDIAGSGWSDNPSREQARRVREQRRRRRQDGVAGTTEPLVTPRPDRWHAWMEHRDALHRLCLRWTHGNVTEAEDLMGQLLTRLLRVEPAEFERVMCPLAWMTRVLRHLYVDVVRSNSRAQAHNAEIGRALHEPTMTDPAAEILGDELIAALRAAIAALPPSLRGPLVQRYIEGLDYQEIAGCHHITLPAARKRCQLARDRIRRRLQSTIT